jgi:cyclomaltodextrinase / maltogenic alpha-amylase / neopullulanase
VQKGGFFVMHWINDAIFYHIYPLGLCGAPTTNDFSAPAVPRLKSLYPWLQHLTELGTNALYLGPIFESTAHGYDTADYFKVDRRLGDNETLRELSQECDRRGIRLVLDGVFNHVGRDFWAFRNVVEKGAASPYCNWFSRLNFAERSPYGDPFSYEGWSGHYDLVKLNLHNPEVRTYLFRAVESWLTEFNISGLRLDAADHLDVDFIEALAQFCRNLRPDFWLMGEVVHGDYRHWANPHRLDATTNYECYKGLYSSHLDRNYFEIAYSLNRLFGANGIYHDLLLYNFVDNHDVNRLASNLTNPTHLYTTYILLFTIPGIPSIYYGSEWGIEGQRTAWDDKSLRPSIDLANLVHNNPQPQLPATIRQLARIRQQSAALKNGDYRQLHVNHEQLVFSRSLGDETIIVTVNASEKPVTLELDLHGMSGNRLINLLNEGESWDISNGKVRLEKIWPGWGCIMRLI